LELAIEKRETGAEAAEDQTEDEEAEKAVKPMIEVGFCKLVCSTPVAVEECA
jgi:hypothetical protein